MVFWFDDKELISKTEVIGYTSQKKKKFEVGYLGETLISWENEMSVDFKSPI